MLGQPRPLLPFEEEGQWRPSEQYRILRTKISQHPKQPRLIAVSSPASGDGKSVTAINTAGALSLKSEGRVAPLDADFRGIRRSTFSWAFRNHRAWRTCSMEPAASSKPWCAFRSSRTCL